MTGPTRALRGVLREQADPSTLRRVEPQPPGVGAGRLGLGACGPKAPPGIGHGFRRPHASLPTALIIAGLRSRDSASPAIVARVLGRGTRGAVAYHGRASLSVGDVVWLTFAGLGLAAIAQAFHGIFSS